MCPATELAIELVIGDFWRVDILGDVTFPGRDLGLGGDDAGLIHGHLHAGAYSPVPESFRPLDVEKATKNALQDLTLEDLF
jgi:hypothetical protein